MPNNSKENVRLSIEKGQAIGRKPSRYVDIKQQIHDARGRILRRFHIGQHSNPGVDLTTEDHELSRLAAEADRLALQAASALGIRSETLSDTLQTEIQSSRQHPRRLIEVGGNTATEAFFPLEERKMYQLPDNPELTDNDIRRYLRSNLRLERDFPQAIVRGLKHKDITIQLEAVGALDRTDEATQNAQRAKAFAVLDKALSSKNIGIKFSAVKAVFKVVGGIDEVDPQKERLQKKAYSFLDQQITHPDQPGYKFRVLEELPNIGEPERTQLLTKAIDDVHMNVQLTAIRVLDSLYDVPQSELWTKASGIIDKALDRGSKFVDRLHAAGLLVRTDKPGRIQFFEKAFADRDNYIRSQVVRSLGEVEAGVNTDELQAVAKNILDKALGDSDLDVRIQAVDALHRLNEPEKSQMLTRAFGDPDVRVRFAAIKALDGADETTQAELRSQISPIIIEGLKNQNSYTRLQAVDLFDRADEETKTEWRSRVISILDQALQDPDVNVEAGAKRLCLKFAVNDPSIRDHYAHIYRKIQELAGETPLYRWGNRRFYEEKLSKTGSETFLLDRVPAGGEDASFRNRLIKRVIGIEPYLTWKKAYEAAAVWKANGFSEVPVEPIVQADYNKDSPMKVDVYTRVLPGPAAMIWESSSGLYEKEIEEAKTRIKQTLDELGIEHGHLHDKNFVVVFDHDANGKPDLLHPPHVYVIDFDESQSKDNPAM